LPDAAITEGVALDATEAGGVAVASLVAGTASGTATGAGVGAAIRTVAALFGGAFVAALLISPGDGIVIELVSAAASVNRVAATRIQAAIKTDCHALPPHKDVKKVTSWLLRVL